MSESDGRIFFKEWLPDLPDLDNPGLTEARNVLPVGGTYIAFKPLASDAASAVLPARPTGYIRTPSGDSQTMLYAGVLARLYVSTDLAAFTALSATLAGGANWWSFARYENRVIATGYGEPALQHTIGSASNFSTLGSTAGTSPKARLVGVIGQFVMLGDTDESVNGQVPHRVQWSGIDLPASWPTANSATAIAQQAGEQFLPAELGPVKGIAGGDQYGVILQQRGITRVTYVGGSVVFQFDRISDKVGCMFPRSIVQVGRDTYFADVSGFYVTNGVEVVSISDLKVTKYFQDHHAQENQYKVVGAVDPVRHLIYWAFPAAFGSPFTPTDMLVYNYVEKRWSLVVQLTEGPINVIGPDNAAASSHILYGFNSATLGTSFTVNAFNGTVGTAILTTGEAEWNPGGYARVQGVRPYVDVTANAVTVAVGSRNDQQSAATYTAETTADSRSGFCGFRNEARYHRARITITGTFNAAQGLEFQVVPSGAT